MSDQQRIETAADNCEVLRARLAKYEDADGNPKMMPAGSVSKSELIDALEEVWERSYDFPAAFALAAKDLAEELNSPPVSSAPSHGEQVRDGFLLARETVVELPDGSKELGYTPMPGLGVFVSNDEVFSAIRELGLPLGWVSVRVGQVIASAPSAGSQEQGE